MSRKDPPRLTVGQALAIFLMLIVGFLVLPDRLSLVVLVAAMGAAAVLLNALFQLVLRWAAPKEAEINDEGE